MIVLPNGLTVFNATPHQITFWREGWEDVVNVPPDEIINAKIDEQPHSCFQPRVPVLPHDCENVWFVRTVFTGTDDGRETIRRAKEKGAEVIVGSLLAAQAYPGEVVAMTPSPGYERRPPSEKRMNPDKFTVFLP